jgi:hypothetical protein
MSKRTIDPAEALVMLKQHQPSFDKMAVAEISQNMRWQDEIAMLERRVKDVYEMVYLGDDDQIAVRTALSEEEMLILQGQEKRVRELKKRKDEIESEESEVDTREELSAIHNELSTITYQQIALMTANPLITAEWLAVNKAKWPVADALVVISAYMESSIRRRVGQVKNIQSFLKE